MNAEHVHEIGYINDAHLHALISISNPALVQGSIAFAQIALSIDGAITLRAELNKFLEMHAVVFH